MRAKDDSGAAPIIIKKINAGHHGHHGGAWKVAYADFVTAMMAFFLLMWLLNSVPSEKLQGIAQYFEPTIGLSGQKGIGFEGGKTPSVDGARTDDKVGGIKYGVTAAGQIIDVKKTGTEISIEEKENENFALVEGELKKIMASDNKLQYMQENVTFLLTPEGLTIRITDQDKFPMFEAGSAELTEHSKNIVFKIAKLVRFSPNFLAISGNTDKSVSSEHQGYSNWELSADRANSARRYLIESGIPPEQIARVVGRADTDPIDMNNPYSPKNRRIEITLLRNSIMPYTKVSAPTELTSAPARNDFGDQK
jgi:chemotaxis protein MotB